MISTLGSIIHLQVQREKIKSGEKPDERYTPQGNLVRVSALKLSPGGVIGLARDGEEIVDVHNVAHPRSRFRGTNGISLLTTGHYAKIRVRFGGHIADGIAAESMLVDSNRILTLDDLAHGVEIEGNDGCIAIHEWTVAHPCAPFSRFACQFPDDVRPDYRLTEALSFLDNGTRGFYGVLPDECKGQTIRIGKVVSLIH